MRYSLIKDENEFKKIRNAWIDLEKVSNNKDISVSYTWVDIWWRIFKNVNNNTLGYDKKLAIIVGYNDNDNIILIAPFVLLKRKVLFFDISFIEFIGQQWGSVSCNLLCSDYDIPKFDELENIIKKYYKYDILYIRQISKKNQKIYSQDFYVYSGCPIIDLHKYNAFSEFYNSKYSKRLKQNIRTALNRAKKDKLVINNRNYKINDEILRNIIAISYTKIIDGKKSIYKNDNYRRFISELIHTMNADAMIIEINEKIAAYRLNIYYNKVKYCIDAAFDRNYRKYDLGILSVNSNIEDSFQQGLEIHNFGPGLDDYKIYFTDDIDWLGLVIRPGSKIRSWLLAKLFKIYMVRYKYKNDIKKVIRIKEHNK